MLLFYNVWLRRYSAWSRQVEADGWKIRTYSKNLTEIIPDWDGATFYWEANIECTIIAALRYMGLFQLS